jgi:predicted transposase/invertase (TIGR01784 family)
LELYNAIQNTGYGKDTEIEITTLESVLYMERINDISFVIDGKIVVLIEHQSTINPNMPLRMLLYIARVYEKIMDPRNLYTKTKMSIPHPEFIVLYNGVDDYPDSQVLKLSDMFVQYGVDNPINLELTVQVYNINKGRNPQFADKSKTLDGYETFIAAAREYEKTMDREEAIGKAIEDCIKQNILKEFLEKHSSEVRNMLLTEWDWDTALRVREEDGVVKGLREGLREGMREGLREGMQKGELKGKMQTAKNLKAKGIDVDTIAEVTGLFVDDILRL